jgi:hypothetical protein
MSTNIGQKSFVKTQGLKKPHLGKITTTTKMYTKMKAFLMNTKTDI